MRVTKLRWPGRDIDIFFMREFFFTSSTSFVHPRLFFFILDSFFYPPLFFSSATVFFLFHLRLFFINDFILHPRLFFLSATSFAPYCQQSMVYKFDCDLCDADYVGYTARHLHQRINAHKYSAIGRHLEQHGLLKTDLVMRVVPAGGLSAAAASK